MSAAALLLAVLTWFRPVWAIALLLALLPFFAHHPATPRAHALIALTATVQLVYVVRRRPSWRGLFRAPAEDPLLLLGALFVAAAVLSLSALPLAGLWYEYQAAATGAPAEWPRQLLAWLRLGEARREFPITSAVLTLQAFGLALMAWRETRADTAAGLRAAAGITTGALTFVSVGLLGSAGLIDVDALRGSTMVETRPGTLQSTAGNPGWFAEYLVYSLPYGLVLLAGSTAVTWRVAGLVGATALASLGLVVSGQRGGWISGALVVLFMGAVGPTLLTRASARLAPGGVLWRGAAALAAVASLVAGGFALWLAGVAVPEATFGAEAYVARLRSIADGDRLAFWPVSLKMARLHPVLGGGHESFAYLYREHFEQPDGRFHASQPLVQSASAHSLYLQTLTGTGIVGLALLGGLFVVAARRAARGFRLLAQDRAGRAVLLASAGSLLGVACYGLVQEVFYIHALRLLFFTGLGLLAAVTRAEPGWSRAARRGLWLALAAAGAVHLAYEHWRPGPTRLLAAGAVTGLHDVEPQPDGTSLRWSGEWATWPVPAGAAGFALQVRSLAPFAQHVEVETCDGERTAVVLRDHDWHALSGSTGACDGGGRLQLRVRPSWRPPDDGRLLGVMTRDVRFDDQRGARRDVVRVLR